MFFSAQKDLQNEVALGGAFQSFLLDVFKKYFLLFRHIYCLRPCCLWVKY
jgi:hypothetical protein